MEIIEEFEIINKEDIENIFSQTNSSRKSRLYRHKYRNEVLYALSKGKQPKCIRCGFNDIRALHIDHVNGGGCAHFKEFRNNRPKYYKSMLSHLEDFQILCANCNAIKVIEDCEADKTQYAY